MSMRAGGQPGRKDNHHHRKLEDAHTHMTPTDIYRHAEEFGPENWTTTSLRHNDSKAADLTLLRPDEVFHTWTNIQSVTRARRSHMTDPH